MEVWALGVTDQDPSVLVLHNEAADYAVRLGQRFPAIRFWPCTLNEAVPALLQTERPRIALTFKIRGSAFPRSARTTPRWPRSC